MHLPNLSRNHLAGVAALACAAALLPMAALAATASPGAPTAAASTPRCSRADLVVWLTYDQSAAGTLYYTRFRRPTCWPGRATGTSRSFSPGP